MQTSFFLRITTCSLKSRISIIFFGQNVTRVTLLEIFQLRSYRNLSTAYHNLGDFKNPKMQSTLQNMFSKG